MTTSSDGSPEPGYFNDKVLRTNGALKPSSARHGEEGSPLPTAQDDSGYHSSAIGELSPGESPEEAERDNPPGASSPSRTPSQSDFDSDGSPTRPAFVSSLRTAESLLRHFSPPPSSSKHSFSAGTSLSPGRLTPRPPTPPITVVSVGKTGGSDDGHPAFSITPFDRPRTVRFNSRVRISCMHPHERTSVSHSSSFSDSSSMSAPLRPAAEIYARPKPSSRAGEQPPLDEMFSSDDYSAWLSQMNLASHRGNPHGGFDPSTGVRNVHNPDPTDEMTPLVKHRRRRRAMEDSANQKKGPPNYIIANGGIPRSPVPSPVLPKKGQYGALGSRPEEDEDEDEEADGDSVSGSSSKTEDSGIYGSWASGWSGGWRSTQSLWSRFKSVICCSPAANEHEGFLR